MKRLAVKRFPEKMMMAVIILSCGFVLHGEPAAHKAKKAAGHPVHKQPHATQTWQHQQASSLPDSRPYIPAR